MDRYGNISIYIGVYIFALSWQLWIHQVMHSFVSKGGQDTAGSKF